ncbi:hypothetical protein NDU88_010892 [Pleurodeles waltl]|uniref:Uncharacterized protein n=1 Tax=Pleurodeles waltl TaxID=8319 RepID=A0AAV7S240_PLEWA|nr:hypothetical protein NDU88_010892 [Pleurodeles waltl]
MRGREEDDQKEAESTQRRPGGRALSLFYAKEIDLISPGTLRRAESLALCKEKVLKAALGRELQEEPNTYLVDAQDGPGISVSARGLSLENLEDKGGEEAQTSSGQDAAASRGDED